MDTLQLAPNEKEMLADLTQYKCWKVCFMIADNYYQRYLIWDMHMYVHSQCTSELWIL